MKTNQKNKITTGGYFLKRLRDSGFIAIRIFKDYGDQDPRKWTIMVDPNNTSLLITCYENKDCEGDIMFEFNDGGNLFPKNFNLKTNSMEVIVTVLIERNVNQRSEYDEFIKK